MSIRVIISGGGTGGHIFPAISIASELISRDPKSDILFVGATGGMEMTLVPKNNFRIEGVTISGLKRPLGHPTSILKNLSFLLKLYAGISHSKKIISKFKPG